MNELIKKLGASVADANHPNCHLQIVGFPCNQFGHEEPAQNIELRNVLKYVRPGNGYEPNFRLAGKLNVNGADEDPIFTFLKNRCPSPFGLIADRNDILWAPIRNNDIKWNFAKFLIDHRGQPYRRYTSKTVPENLEDDIRTLIDKCKSDSGTQIAQLTPTDTAPDPIIPVKAASQTDAQISVTASPSPTSDPSNNRLSSSADSQPSSSAISSPNIAPNLVPGTVASAAVPRVVNKISAAGSGIAAPEKAEVTAPLNSSPKIIQVSGDSVEYIDVRKRQLNTDDRLFY